MDIAKTLEAVVRLTRILAAQNAPALDADDVIGVSAVLPPWEEGQYAAGNVVQYNGQPWKCVLAHDSTGNPLWAPGAAPSLWSPYHATSALRALPWQAPTGGHDAYMDGEYMVWTDGVRYLCVQDNTVHGPDVLPNYWKAV